MFETVILVSVEYSQLSIAEVRDGALFDFEVERSSRLLGNVYLGRVETILPGLDAAFIDIGLSRNALIYAGDIGAVNNIDNTQQVPIEKLLRVGDKIVVQIARAPVGSKGARVTGRLSLLGRYLVLATHSENVGVSRRIESAPERERLRRLMEKLRPLDHSVIVRTEAAGVSEQELARDVQLLLHRLERIESKAQQVTAPALLYREIGLLGRMVRDRLNDRVAKIVVDSPIEYSLLRELIEVTSPHLADRVSLHDAPEHLFAAYKVETALEEAGERVVNLPRGGYLVLDEAEALTAIDVNTGHFVGKSRLADTILQTNLEAAQEAARQLRLRNIGGVIVIDFIDMERTRDRVKVMDALEQALREDRTRTRIVQLSPLGLVEMTRRREGDSMRQVTSSVCPYCEGEGRIQSPSTVALQAHREVHSLVAEQKRQNRFQGQMAVLVTLHPSVALEFLGDDGEAVRTLENATAASVFLRVSAALHQETRHIELGYADDFALDEKKFGAGARFEIAPGALMNDDLTFAVVNRVLVRVDESQKREKSENGKASLWVEVVKSGRWFVDVHTLAVGAPKLAPPS